MVELQKINPIWSDRGCIVVATGPSLTPEVVQKVRFARWLNGWNVVLVQDAYKVLPYADLVYGSNPSWWRIHQHCEGFKGEKWSSHEAPNNGHVQHLNDKTEAAQKWGVNLIKGKDGIGFSFDPEVIHYGSNSGFQAINLALLFGARKIVLVGFDMRHVNGKAHFFGNHPKELHQNTDEHYRAYVKHFDRAAKKLPSHISIVNATPGSALTCFPAVDLEDTIGRRAEICRQDDRVHSDGSQSHAATG